MTMKCFSYLEEVKRRGKERENLADGAPMPVWTKITIRKKKREKNPEITFEAWKGDKRKGRRRKETAACWTVQVPRKRFTYTG